MVNREFFQTPGRIQNLELLKSFCEVLFNSIGSQIKGSACLNNFRGLGYFSTLDAESSALVEWGCSAQAHIRVLY